jgi:hypothetical protein
MNDIFFILTTESFLYSFKLLLNYLEKVYDFEGIQDGG